MHSICQGIDLTSVKRLELVMRRGGPAFIQRVFAAAEHRYCRSKRRKYEHYAARFAAKEAVIKALKIPKGKTLGMREIEVRHHATGKPYVRLAPAARKRLRLPSKMQIEISLSHEREYAIAAVLITGIRGKR